MPPPRSPKVISQTAPDPSRQPPNDATSVCRRGGAHSLTSRVVALPAQRKSRYTLSVPEKPTTGRVPAQPKRVPYRALRPVECDTMTDTSDHIAWFRHTGPYIKAHRGRTFVIYLGNGALESPALNTLVHDLALLHSLGVKLVLVHATRSAIDAALPTDPSLRRSRRHSHYRRRHFAIASEIRRGSGSSWSNCCQWAYPTPH
jgi:hypothetical protein